MHSEFNGLLYLSPDKRINLLSTLQRRIRAFKYHYEYLGITLRGKTPLKVVFHPLPFFWEGRESHLFLLECQQKTIANFKCCAKQIHLKFCLNEVISLTEVCKNPSKLPEGHAARYHSTPWKISFLQESVALHSLPSIFCFMKGATHCLRNQIPERKSAVHHQRTLHFIMAAELSYWLQTLVDPKGIDRKKQGRGN